MFALSSKVKIAAGIAAGVLTLGAAGAYAANANNTITTYPLTGSSGSLSHNGQTLNLVSTSQNASLSLPSTPFKDAGQCVSFFAKNKSLALQPTTGNTVRRNYHGKLMSSLQRFCATYQSTTSGATTDSETPDATQSAAPETEQSDAAAPQSGASHGHGNGHGKHAQDND